MPHTNDCMLTDIADDIPMDDRYSCDISFSGWCRDWIRYWRGDLRPTRFRRATRTSTLIHCVALAKIAPMLGTMATDTASALNYHKHD